jgi:uncharacterized protein YbgA (DUF1722 family)
LNGSAPGGAAKRRTDMIPRENILPFLFEMANFSPEDFIERWSENMKNQSISQLLKVQKQINSLIHSRTSNLFSIQVSTGN